MWVLNPNSGMLSQILSTIGINTPGWFTDPNWTKPAVIMMSLWMVGTSTVLYLAALQNVPQELHESAMLDGANFLQRTIRIIIPLVSPVTLFMFITGIIDALQIFTPVYVMAGDNTLGSPEGSLLFFVLYLFQNGFNYMKMGYASAMALVMFIALVLLTLVIVRTSSSWVYYEGGRRQ